MWVRDPICLCGVDRRVWSPICGALIAAFAFEADVAYAAEAHPAPSLDPAASHDSLSPPAKGTRGPLVALPPVLPPAPAAAPPVHEEQIRLDANAVLSLNELFRDPVHWRAPFPSYENSIRTLQFDVQPAPDPDRAEPLTASAFSASPEASWLDEHIELSFDDGVAYRQSFSWRGMNLRLKIWGPVLKGDPGLGVRLRGLQLGGCSVEVRARATSNLQDVQVQIAF
jgi:hypothetical protein